MRSLQEPVVGCRRPAPARPHESSQATPSKITFQNVDQYDQPRSARPFACVHPIICARYEDRISAARVSNDERIEPPSMPPPSSVGALLYSEHLRKPRSSAFSLLSPLTGTRAIPPSSYDGTTSCVSSGEGPKMISVPTTGVGYSLGCAAGTRQETPARLPPPCWRFSCQSRRQWSARHSHGRADQPLLLMRALLDP